VCFLAGFGIVSALAGGDEPQPQAATAVPSTAPGSPSTAEDAPPPSTTAATTAPAETQTPTTTVPPDETDTARPPSEPGAVEIDYGRWEGMFELTDVSLVPSLQASTVGGQFTYLGGVGCPVRNVVVEGRFYDRDQIPVGVASWESSRVTAGAGLKQGKPVPFGAYGSVLHLATSAELEVVKVVCAR
jgi:hypothetical protein